MRKYIFIAIIALVILFFWNRKHPISQMGQDFRNLVSNSTSSRQATEKDAQQAEAMAASLRRKAKDLTQQAAKARENAKTMNFGYDVEAWAVDREAASRLHEEKARQLEAQAAAIRKQAQGQKESEAYAARQQKTAPKGGSPRKAQEDYVGVSIEDGWYILSFN